MDIEQLLKDLQNLLWWAISITRLDWGRGNRRDVGFFLEWWNALKLIVVMAAEVSERTKPLNCTSYMGELCRKVNHVLVKLLPPKKGKTKPSKRKNANWIMFALFQGLLNALCAVFAQQHLLFKIQLCTGHLSSFSGFLIECKCFFVFLNEAFCGEIVVGGPVRRRSFKGH